MSTGRAYVVGMILLAVFGIGQIVLRSQTPPSPDELVPWGSFETLGEPPYDRPVLLEFSAGWCVPCRRMQVTTFRDPQFLSLLEKRDLRPVRIVFEEDERRFEKVMEQYGVEGLPAMVVIDRDGRHAAPIVGHRSARDLKRPFDDAFHYLETRLYWNPSSFHGSGDPGRLTVLNFDTWWYLPREQQVDWRTNPTLDLANWCGRHLDLVNDRFRLHVPGVQHYERHRVSVVPTLVVLDHRQREIARFEGAEAVASAPGEMARVAREHGLDVQDPPMPFSTGKRAR